MPLPRPDPGPDALLAALTRDGGCGRVLSTHRVPARTARTADMPPWVVPALVAALGSDGITNLWSHQREAADLVRAGRHCALSTGTASGKSLGYLLPLLTDLVDGATEAVARPPTAIYLAPTKALAGDQLARITSYDLPGVRAATYDGDTPGDERAWIRRNANLILTNPDMLHRALLPAHPRWAPFWRGLRYVVVDESHTYKGVFGAHTSAVLRRLRRVAAHHGASPVFVFASATVSDAAGHASTLLGEPVTEVSDDGSPRAAATFALATPLPPAGTLTTAGRMLARLTRSGAGTIVFARSRAGSEVVAARAVSELSDHGEHEGRDEHGVHTESDRELTHRVAAYRGGYLPEDRRRLEAQLRDGSLLGVAATSALELGIDISGLDAVVLAGWPGTRAALWQRAGRAGRSGQESLTVLLASDDPLDMYLVHHPEAVFDSGVEPVIVDPVNPHVLGPHLAAAAHELPLRPADVEWFGPSTVPLAEQLASAGLLRRRRDGWYWTRSERPADSISLRGAGEQTRIVERETGRVIGTVDEARAHSAVHAGAVHLHQGDTYVVTALDLDTGTATVTAGDPGWSTVAQSLSAFDIVAVRRRHECSGGVTLFFGDVLVRSQVVSFERRLPDGSIIGHHPLDLPERRLATKAVWWTLEPDALSAAGIAPEVVPGSAHAAEHAAIGMMPLVTAVDRWDIGGVSTACHPDTGLPTIMIYDGTQGGAGFAGRGFLAAAEWLDGTAEAIAGCPCETGCPACVQSPKCGNGNEPLDKAGALALLRLTVAALLAGGAQG